MEEHKKKIGIIDTHTLLQTDSKWEQRGGQDTDTYWYDEIDICGNIVAKYVLKDSTSIYPPHERNVDYEKLS